jgi:hypothetical protein
LIVLQRGVGRSGRDVASAGENSLVGQRARRLYRDAELTDRSRLKSAVDSRLHTLRRAAIDRGTGGGGADEAGAGR